MTYWTIAYTPPGGSETEKTLSDWGITIDISLSMSAKTHGRLSIRTAEVFDAGAQQFAYAGSVVVWRDRTAVGTGGTIYFQGYVAQLTLAAEGGKQYNGYEVYDVWWLMERLAFKKSRQAFAGYSTPNDPSTAPTFTTEVCPEVYLGENTAEAYQTVGAQIVEILNWLNECYNATKRGATSGRSDSGDVVKTPTTPLTEFPSNYIPVTRVNNPYCADAMIAILRWTPSCLPHLDHTTTPPTFHCKSLATMSEVTMTISAEQEKQIRVSPSYDRQLAGIFIKYRRIDVENGVGWPVFITDKYPGTITEYTPDVSNHFVELAGAQLATTSVAVAVTGASDVRDISYAVSGTAASRKAFWYGAGSGVAGWDPTLMGANIDDATITATAATVQDKDGNTISTSGKHILISGQVSTWMGVTWQEAIVTAELAYTQYADASHKVVSAKLTRKVSIRVILTNAKSITYRTIQSYVSGEAPPTGVAQAVYESLCTLQYSGSVEFVGSAIKSGIRPGVKLKLVGPNTTFSNLMVQSVEEQPCYGRLRVEFGPAGVLDAPGLIELRRLADKRMVYNMPSGRSSGQGSGPVVGLGDSVSGSDTLHGVSDKSCSQVVGSALT